MDCHDRLGIVGQEAGRPERIGQVCAASLQLSAEAPIEDHHGVAPEQLIEGSGRHSRS